MGDSTCLFCRVPAKEILIEHPLVLAKRDGYPLSRGHTLIIPRRHVVSFFETTEDERMAMLRTLDEARAILESAYSPNGYNIGINNGEAAGQTVMHVHIHLIPRYAGDRPDPRGGVRWVLPEKAAYWEK